MKHKCCEPACGADACSYCGGCLTEHNEDPIMNCPKQPIHRTSANCKRIKGLETIIQEAANDLYDLYDKCNNTTEPEVYGAILGLHERLELALEVES